MSAPAASSGARRWLIAGAVALLVLALGGYLAIRAGVALVEREVVAALGPGASVGSVRGDWNDVEISDLRIAAGPDWPGEDYLRAEHVRIAPSWRSLFSDRIEIAKVEVTNAYLSALRSRDGLQVLPTLLTKAPDATAAVAATAPPAATPAEHSVEIASFQLENGVLELFDATAASPPWKIRLQEIAATLGDVKVPVLSGHMPFEVTALLAGPGRNGHVAASGWLDASTRDLDMKATLRGADLLALRPYFVKTTKAQLAGGALDLELHATVAARQLHAPGRLTLFDLRFGQGSNAATRLFGIPRDILLAGLGSRGGKITLDFSLDGNIDDPQFSLDEMLSTRVAVEVAKVLGFSVGGLVEGVGGIGLDTLEGAGKAAGGLGSALKKLIK